MEYKTEVHWQRNGKDFTVKTYDRSHEIQFAGGVKIPGSAAPEFLGNAQLVNPEELFIASLASCFMLTFLYLAAMQNVKVESYQAKSVGKLGKNAEGKMAMTEVTIHPTITFTDNQQPDAATLQALFQKAHDTCFISCSVKTKVVVAH